MTDAIDAIAAKLIDAAYELFGRPPEEGGKYIAEVTQHEDVPAYFRRMLLLAREPRSPELWERLERGATLKTDAKMVMDAGLKSLWDSSALPAEQRSVIEEIRQFEEWYAVVDMKFVDELNELAAREAESSNKQP